MPASLQQLTGKNGIVSVELHPYHNRALLHLDGSFTGSAEELAANLNLPAGALRSAAFGFATLGGSPMWLTHDVVLMLSEGNSLSTYADLLQQYGARF